MAVLFGVLSFQLEQRSVMIGLQAGAIASLYLVGAFVYFDVWDRGGSLLARFGPLPMFFKRIEYEKLQSAEPGRSSLIDGWGVHWVPTRGWTFNLWGFDCVELVVVGGRRLRIGTDDVDGLVAHLRDRMEGSSHADR